LLSQFRIEEIRVGFEFICQSLIRLVNESCLVTYTLEECVIDFSLDVIVVEPTFILTIIVENRTNVSFDFLFFLIKGLYYLLVWFLFIEIGAFDVLHVLTHGTKFLDFGSKECFTVFNFLFYLANSFCYFLQSLIFLIVEKFFLVWYSLDLIFNVWISRNTFLSFQILHEVTKVLCTRL
jgi:hypothetical protein